jgi:hypothetical protein
MSLLSAVARAARRYTIRKAAGAMLEGFELFGAIGSIEWLADYFAGQAQRLRVAGRTARAMRTLELVDELRELVEKHREAFAADPSQRIQ